MEMADISCRLDDIEDGSDLRRGHPAAHGVFGVPQTINAASYAIVEAVRKAHELSSTISGSTEIAFGGFPSRTIPRLNKSLTCVWASEQLRDLHIGQSYDLYWTRHAACPTEEEYLEMVSKSKLHPCGVSRRTTTLTFGTETGGLFRLLSRLMCSHLDNE
jgi:geranylgeranyl pyrophosphate synthase